MKIFLGASDRQQFFELQSWGDLLLSNSFIDLEQWVRSKTEAWGEGYVFIETVMPRGNEPSSHNNQYDLLICFDSRMAICEMKRQDTASTIPLDAALFQIRGQMQWMENLLKSEGYDFTGLSPNLFCPRLDFHDLETLRRTIRDRHASWHIWAIGADGSLRGKHDDELRPYYLSEALQNRLERRSSRLTPQQKPFGNFIQKKLISAGARLLEFDSFGKSHAYLRSVATASRHFIWDTWYVSGLFTDAVATISKKLQTPGVVEIIGPPGSGKSTLAKETIEVLGEDWVELKVRKTSSRSDVSLIAQKALRGESPTEFSESVMLQSLAEEPTIFWVREYDQASSFFLLELLDALRIVPNTRSRWIIESNNGLSAFNHLQWELRPFGGSALSQIIEKLKPGGYFTDPEQVVELAQGNPRRAIRLWRSRDQADAETPDEIEWFKRQLSVDEKQMLSVVCHAVHNSPVGVTLALLCRWALAVFPDRSAEHCQKTLSALLSKLEGQQLARISHLSREAFGGRLNAVLPEQLQLTVIDHLASGVISSTDLNLVEQRLGPDCEALSLTLLDSGEKDSLGFVTAALLQGDIEPFFRSSFRLTALPVVPDWFARTGRLLDTRQSYLLKALRVLMQVGRRADLSAERDLGAPSSDDSLLQYAFAVTKWRVAAYHGVPENFDIDREIATANTEDDSALRAERLFSLARSLQHSNRPRDSWRMLQTLMSLSNSASNRFLAHIGVLEFLNRRKQRETIVSDAEAFELILFSSREMLEYASHVENLQAICDALFYYVRSQELIAELPSDDAIEGYGNALEFIERSRRRSARRLQVLLTHGSLHRHACRRNDISWDDFRRHMDTAFIWFGRAFKSASSQNHLQHKLNALCYMIDLCLKALRFVNSGNRAVRVIMERALEVLQVARTEQPVIDSVLAPQKHSTTLSMVALQKQNLFRNLNENLPFLLYIEALIVLENSAARTDALQKAWMNVIAGAQEQLRHSSYENRAKYCSAVWARIERLVQLGETYDCARNATVFYSVGASIDRILEITRPSGGPSVRKWNQVATLVKKVKNGKAINIGDMGIDKRR